MKDDKNTDEKNELHSNFIIWLKKYLEESCEHCFNNETQKLDLENLNCVECS
jgi:hypothetical protein